MKTEYVLATKDSKMDNIYWGETLGSTVSLGGGAWSSHPDYTEPINGLGNAEGLSGWCPEMVVYGRVLSPYERVSVETYLALKYGISLDGSYYYKNRLLWDTSNSSWNRITGVINDSDDDFRQCISTTSYEETPRFSSLPANDSFFRRNSHSKASANRLIAIGRLFSDDIHSPSYMMWGDNGGNTTTTAMAGNWHGMGRRWLIHTDIDTVSVQPPTITSSGVSLTVRGNVVDFSAHTTGTPYISIGPATSSDLHYGFTCPARNYSFFIGTARLDETECSEGYYFDDGRVYRVILGETEDTPVVTNAKGHDIDIFKWGDHLYLQIDGEGDADYNIIVPLDQHTPTPHIWEEGERSESGADGRTDTEGDGRFVDNNLFEGYSCLGLIKPAAGSAVSDLRIDGFSDTGTYAELSYAIAGGGEFSPYRNRRTYLLASGFGGTRTYRSTGFDPDRRKILFHNLLLADSDTVTFAWNDGLLADVDAEEASCDESDGVINIHAHGTEPGLSYLLSDSPYTPGTGTPIPMSGCEHTIPGLATGTYFLTLFQKPLSNLCAWSGSDNEYMTAPLPSGSNDISWKYDGSGNEYTAGIRVSGTAVRYGVKMRNDTAWFVRNGAASSPRRLSKGDSIHVKYASGKVYVKINNTQVYNTATKTTAWMFRANFGRGKNALQDYSGTTASPTLSSDRVMLDNAKADTLHYMVFIGDGCYRQGTQVIPLDGDDGFMPGKPRQPEYGMMNPSGILQAASDPASPLSVTAVLPPGAASGPVQMLVFDVSGRLHRKGRVMSVPPYRDTFTVSAPGVYIVKAITGNGEHTAKIAIGL